jgi:hypothetical protein
MSTEERAQPPPLTKAPSPAPTDQTPNIVTTTQLSHLVRRPPPILTRHVTLEQRPFAPTNAGQQPIGLPHEILISILNELAKFLASIPQYTIPNSTDSRYVRSSLYKWHRLILSLIIINEEIDATITKSFSKAVIAIHFHFLSAEIDGSHNLHNYEPAHPFPLDLLYNILYHIAILYRTLPKIQRSSPSQAQTHSNAIFAFFTAIIATVATTNLSMDIYLPTYYGLLKEINKSITIHFKTQTPESFLPLNYYDQL